jgi:hypothetical protein
LPGGPIQIFQQRLQHSPKYTGDEALRTTYIRNLTLKRDIPYDPDFHGLIDSKLSFKLNVENVDANSAVFEIIIEANFKTKDTQEEMGKISAIAETKVTGFDFSLKKDGSLDVESMPENLKRVIEGAVFEDLMLHLSSIARYAHLPSLFPIPIIFPRSRLPKDKPKANRIAGMKRLPNKQ